MKNFPGNPHAEVTEADIEYPGAWDTLEAVTALLQTNARATLALAFEQRTANNIAALHLQAISHQTGTSFSEAAADQLNNRLGWDAA